MVCSINNVPTYIQELNVSDETKLVSRNTHNSIVNNLMGLTNKDNLKVFIVDSLMGYPVTILNPAINPSEAMALASGKIAELNNTYSNSAKILDSAGKKVLAVNVSEFAEDYNKNLNPNNDFLLADTGKNFDVEAHAKQRREPSIQANLVKFFDLLGIDVRKTKMIEDNMDAVAVARISKRLVEYVEGAEKELTEEAAHFLTTLMPQDHPIMQEALADIVNHPEYEQVKQEYANRIEYTELKKRHEAIGRLVANRIRREQPSGWIQKMIQWFRNLVNFANQKEDDVYDNLKYRLLNADISDLSYDNVLDELMANDVFYSQSRYQKIIDSLETSPKKEKIFNDIKKMFAGLTDLKRDIVRTQEKADGSTLTILDQTISFLKSSIAKMENTSLNTVNTFVDMVLQMDDIMEDFANQTFSIAKIDDPNARLLKVNQLHLSTRVLIENLVPKISKVHSYLENGDFLERKIADTLKNANYIKGFIEEQYFEVLAEIFPERFKARADELKQKFEKKLAPLNDALKKAMRNNDKAAVERIQAKIKSVEEELNSVIPTEDNIRDMLMGLGGDASSFSYLLEAAAMNGNIFINELSNIIRQAIYSRFDQLNEVLNSSQNAIDKFKKATGRSINNLDDFYKNLIEEVEIYDGVDAEGKAKSRKVKALVGEHDKAYIFQLQKMTIEINKKTSEWLKESNTEKKVKLEKELKELKQNKKKWELENMEMPYTEAYYKVDALLDEDLGNGVTARSFTKDIYEELNNQYLALKNAKDTDNIVLILQNIDELNFRLRDLRSDYKKSGMDLKVAKQLQKYSEQMKPMVEWKITERTEAQHKKYILELQRQYNNNQITKEAYELLLNESYTEEFSKEYWEKKKKIADKIKQTIELFGSKNMKTNEKVKENISELYKELEKIAGRKRNSDGIIEGSEFPTSEVEEVRRIEMKIKEFRDELIKASGYTQKDIIRKKEIITALSFEENQDKEDELRRELTEINERAKKSELDESTKQLLSDLISELMALTISEPTEFYKERLDEEKSKIEVPPINREEPYNFGGGFILEYDPTRKLWVSNFRDNDGNYETYEDAEIVSLYEDDYRKKHIKETEWYKNNHISKTVYNEATEQEEIVDDPLYIWKRSTPKNPDYIKKVPAFRFRERIVKETNSNYKNSVDGYNLPKKGKFVNPNFAKLSAPEKEFLKYMTDLYLTIQESKLPVGKRLGLFLPSIEKGSYEKMTNFSIQEVGKSLRLAYEGAKRRLMSNEQDEDLIYGNFNDDVLGEMPVLFSGKIDAKNQSSDALQSILTFVSFAMKYDSLKKVKPVADALKSVASNREYAPVAKPKRSLLRTLIDSSNKRFKGKADDARIKGENTFEKHVNEIIRTIFYGESQYEETLGKTIDQTMGIVATATLGGKVMMQMKNNIAGKIQMMLAGTMFKNKVYSAKNLRYGQMMSFAALKDLMADHYQAGNLGFYHQLLNKFNAFQGEFYNNFGHKISASVLKDAVNFKELFMIPKNVAEIEMQVVNALAVLDAIYVEDNGKKVPLHQAFELKDGLIKAKPGIDSEVLKRKVEEAINKIMFANIVTNGNYDKINSVVASKYTLGRMLLFLNKYFAPFLVARVGRFTYNASINETYMGYYRQFAKTILDDVRNKTIPIYNMVVNSDEYTEEEKQAALTTAYELAILMLFGVTLSLLFGDDEDRYEKLKKDPNSYAKAQLLSLILSVKLETETLHPFYGLDNIAQKVKSPFPISRLLENSARLLHTLDFSKEDFYQRDSGIYKKGDWKGIAYALKLSGIEGIELEFKDPVERLKHINNSQFIRQ